MANGEWPTLAKLAGMDAPDQRRVLRLHKEGTFRTGDEEDQKDTKLRLALDEELQRIMERELCAQADPKAGKSEKYKDIPDFEKLLKKSPAFVQYLNYYLYFGVRFAAGRISNPCDHPASASDADCNEAPAGLPSPPLCDELWFAHAEIGKDRDKFLQEVLPADRKNHHVHGALDFLDDFLSYSDKWTKYHPDGVEASARKRPDGDEHTNFELWLRGLYFGPEEGNRFRELSAGLLLWTKSRYEFYTGLESKASRGKRVETWKQERWREGHWNVNNPLAARCALVDFYWLARILRAEVSARGLVAYSSRSWLYYLAVKKPAREEMEAIGIPCADERGPSKEECLRWKEDILRWEEVLRSVFGYACELIQNAVELAEECDNRHNNPGDYPSRPRPETTKSWRAVYDQEMQEIRNQRKQWRHSSNTLSMEEWDSAKCVETKERKGWSRRIWTGEDVENLVGIALSGGGIRSATFNLGMLQRLQELDLLRHVDYLSTVSGGGYIGGWLVANVRRTRYWLSRMSSWDKSIEHLRRYSNYLAPQNGILSADTWTMWGTWIRNALLIQLNAFVWLASMLVSVLILKSVFDWSGQGPRLRIVAEGLTVASLAAISLILSYYLGRLSHNLPVPRARLFSKAASTGSGLPILAAFLAWISSFLTAALLWGQAIGDQKKGLEYSWIFRHSLSEWSAGVKWAFLAGLLLIACSQVKSVRTAIWSGVTYVLTTLASYLTLCGLLRLYAEFVASSVGVYSDRGGWVAFVVGPPVAMTAVAVAVILFIGLLGRDARDDTREWWTRYGAWIGMIGVGAALLALAAIFAPLWVLKFANLTWWKTVKGGAVLAWLGSVISGLLAGKSSRTGQDGGGTSPVLQWAAWVGGFLFIVGAVALAATGVYLALGEVLLTDFDSNPDLYWQNLTALNQQGFLMVIPRLAVIPQWLMPGQWVFPHLAVIHWLYAILAGLILLALLFSRRFDLNTFGLNQFYRNRVVRCYLGATRWQPGKRHPHPFTGFDDDDDVALASLSVSYESKHDSQTCGESFRGPFPLINCTLNLGGSSDLALHTRQSASFTLTPPFCGADRQRVGYAPTGNGYAGRVTLGQAVSVSGAAASPNQGYNTSPLVSFLLTMFNVRLGWWFSNPGTSKWNKTGPLGAEQLVEELFGMAGEGGNFINISDGGHFENLGIYELIRRRARVIIAADAECDPELAFGSLGNVVRICDTDFGAKIDIDVSSIRKQADSGVSHSHCAVGVITYSNGTLGYLIYIKSSLTSDEDVGVAQYRSAHPTFPHESTADQFFSEDQFEAYRRLGHHITERTFRSADNEALDPFLIASKLYDLWVPAGFSNDAFLKHTQTFVDFWDRFRTDPKLSWLFYELTGKALPPPQTPPGPLSVEELCACMELLQLMENVFLDLRLDDFWDHPDNRGWAVFFGTCAQSPKVQETWNKVRGDYGIRFEYFCERHLGLERDRPVIRV